ncbi:MAG: NAD(P)-binding domain-containing protein, partial [Flavobacteriales bacterium]|nr:NAD(P)-binding domain-containing protein [Flavobacteriales bacterium]
MKDKYKIVIIGSGNIAEHLLRAFDNSDNSEVIQLYSRNITTGEELCSKFDLKFTNSLEGIKLADLYLICVSDTAITEVSNSLPFSNRLVAHTSGATSIEGISD